jgi:hypothetical protein
MTTMTTREAWHQRSRSSRATSKAAFIVAALLFAFGAIPLDTATAAPEMAPTAPGRPSNSSNPAWHGEEYCSLHGSHDVGPSVHLRSRKTMKTYPRTHWRRAFLPYGGPVVWAVLREPRPGQTVWIEWLRPYPTSKIRCTVASHTYTNDNGFTIRYTVGFDPLMYHLYRICVSDPVPAGKTCTTWTNLTALMERS